MLIGVLAVGCVPNEPSNGIEAMRIAKAGLLDANAQLTLAKVQVEAAKAAVLQAKATLLQAEAERVRAQAQVELAKADLIKSKAELQRATNDYLKQKWAIKIAEQQLELQEFEAQVQASIKGYELAIQMMQTELVKAQKDYEKAMLKFQEWKAKHANDLTNLQLEQLNDIIDAINGVTLEIAYEQVRLNTAKAAYSAYVEAYYPMQTEEIALELQQEIRVLQCAIDYQEGLVAAYTEMYNNYHGEFDAFIAGLRDQVTAWEEEIVNDQLVLLQSAKDMVDRYVPMQDAFYALTVGPQPAIMFRAWEDGEFADDFTVGVWSQNTLGSAGIFFLPSMPIGDVNVKAAAYPRLEDDNVVEGVDAIDNESPYVGQIDIIEGYIATIADTRAEFEGQGAADVEAYKAAIEAQAQAANAKYISNWNAWQAAYAGVQPATGALYQAWAASYAEYKLQLAAYNKNKADYKALYEAAEEAVATYMDGMNNTYDSGTLGQYLGSAELSAALGGITFNASALLDFIWGGTLIYPALDAFLTYLSQTDLMNGCAITLKNVMDGTYGDYDPFWTVADGYAIQPGYDKPIATAVMPGIYNGETGKGINDLTVADYHKWLFLYWLFEDKTLSVGMNGWEAFFQVNPSSYQDATAQFMIDFYGSYNASEYAAILKAPSNAIYATDMENYFVAVDKLTSLEKAMFEPFNRSWSVIAANGSAITRANAADPSKIAKVVSDPETYLAPEAGEDPIDAMDFFFRIEDFAGQDVYPSLDLTETYLDSDCNLAVSYSALLAAKAYCGSSGDAWAGDMVLYYRNQAYAPGHFFAGIKLQRDADAYITRYNHVINGDYANLQATLEAKLEELYATKDALWDAFDEAYAAYSSAVRTHRGASNEIESLENFVMTYRQLLQAAQVAHSDGVTGLPDGLAESLNDAEEKLMELNQKMAALQGNLTSWNEGYGIFDIDALRHYDRHGNNGAAAEDGGRGHRPRVTPLQEQYWNQYQNFLAGFIPNLTAVYTAEIDVIMNNISGLLAELQVLEAQRAAIAAAIGVTLE